MPSYWFNYVFCPIVVTVSAYATKKVPFVRWGQRGRAVGTAHAPPAPSFQTGRPSFFALSARLPWMPVPGNTMTPIGSTSSIASLRLNGAAWFWAHHKMGARVFLRSTPDGKRG